MRQIVEQFAAVKAERLALERQAAELKETEDKLKAQLIFELQAQGMKTINFQGLGRVTVSEKSHYEIFDKSLLVRAQLGLIVSNADAGVDLSDGLLLQGRVSKDNLEALVERLSEQCGQPVDVVLSSVGVKKVTEPSLSLTKL